MGVKVYVVERGCYSDRYVSAVFSSRELAEENIAQHTKDGLRDGWNSEGDVEEYELDDQAGHVRRTAFRVRINLETGSVERERQYDTVAAPHPRGEVEEVKDHREYAWSKLGLHRGIISYESFEHAEKLAAEARQAWLRETAVDRESQSANIGNAPGQ